MLTGIANGLPLSGNFLVRNDAAGLLQMDIDRAYCFAKVPHNFLTTSHTGILTEGDYMTTTTYVAQGSDTITHQMALGEGLPEELVLRMLPVADGNPGCMRYLIEMRKQILPDEGGFSCLLSCLKQGDLHGTRLYSHIKMHGTVDKAVSAFRKAGWC